MYPSQGACALKPLAAGILCQRYAARIDTIIPCGWLKMVAEGEEVKPGSDTFLQEFAPNKIDPRCYVRGARYIYSEISDEPDRRI